MLILSTRAAQRAPSVSAMTIQLLIRASITPLSSIAVTVSQTWTIAARSWYHYSFLLLPGSRLVFTGK